MDYLSFKGSKEVIYGLNNAAKFAKEAAINKAAMQEPRPINYTAEYKKNIALAEAYLDMATYDDTFISTLSEISTTKKDSLAKILQKNINQHYIEINPFSIFSASIVKKYLNNNKNTNMKVLMEFLTSLKR